MSKEIDSNVLEQECVQLDTVDGGEVTLSHALTEAQLLTSLELRGQLDTVIQRVKASKLKLKEKAALLATMVKAHETLTKTERMSAGLSDKTHTTVNAGVIVVPEKLAGKDWHSEAIAEVERAKALG